MKTTGSGDHLFLDERGKEFSAIEPVDFIEKRMIASDKRIVFVIVGAYGVDEEVLQRANLKWFLSDLVFLYQIVRLILSETVYRAITVIKNEPYHHQTGLSFIVSRFCRKTYFPECIFRYII